MIIGGRKVGAQPAGDISRAKVEKRETVIPVVVAAVEFGPFAVGLGAGAVVMCIAGLKCVMNFFNDDPQDDAKSIAKTAIATGVVKTAADATNYDCSLKEVSRVEEQFNMMKLGYIHDQLEKPFKIKSKL